MEAKKGRFAPPAVGGSALLAVFAVLCLTVFALLSLSTVRADARLADASANAVTAYYAADTRAEEVLALLRAGEWPEDVDVTLSDGVFAEGYDEIYEYAVPISETQELRVTACRLDDTWTVTRWQAAPIGGEEFDDFLELWDGGDGTTF